MAALDLFAGEGGSGPPRPVGAGWPVMGGPSHVAPPDPPEETGSTGATRGLFQPSWGRGDP
jgi:hypothetical protein